MSALWHGYCNTICIMAFNPLHTIKPNRRTDTMKSTNWTVNALTNTGTVISESLTETPSMITRALSLTANKTPFQIICHSQNASLNCLAFLASDRLTAYTEKYKVTATFDKEKFFLSIIGIDDILSHPFPAPVVELTSTVIEPTVTKKHKKGKK